MAEIVKREIVGAALWNRVSKAEGGKEAAQSQTWDQVGALRSLSGYEVIPPLEAVEKTEIREVGGTQYIYMRFSATSPKRIGNEAYVTEYEKLSQSISEKGKLVIKPFGDIAPFGLDVCTGSAELCFSPRKYEETIIKSGSIKHGVCLYIEVTKQDDEKKESVSRDTVCYEVEEIKT